MSSEEGSSSKAAVAVAGGTAAAGCLMSPAVLIVIAAAVLVLGGLATLLAPVLLIFHGIDVGAAAGKNPTSSKPVNAGPPPQIDPDKVSASVRGDGTGTLVMDPLQTFFGVGGLILQGIKDAGCTEITPIVIAAQLDVASGLDRNKVGPNGVKGITQVPIDTLKQFG